MKLDKDIVFFDIETTGLEISKDRIIELSMVKLKSDSSREEFYSKFNPGNVEITKEAYEKHGINIEDLRNSPIFKDKVDEIYTFIIGCDLGGYNAASFDIPFLVEEFIRNGKIYNPRGCSIIDPLSILREMEPRTLEGSYKFYTGKTLTNAHSATADINATIEIFEIQLKKYQEFENLSIKEISEKTLNITNNVDLAGKFQKAEDGNIIISFGKHKGVTVGEVYKKDSRYFEWMQSADGFSVETKIIAKKIYEKLKSLR